jgi:hypothetical protein
VATAVTKLADAATRERLMGALGNPRALAAVAKQIGLQADDLSLLTAMTAAAAAPGVIAQAAVCGAECPMCHGLTCFFDGKCGLTTPHTVAHKCNLNHQWR